MKPHLLARCLLLAVYISGPTQALLIKFDDFIPYFLALRDGTVRKSLAFSISGSRQYSYFSDLSIVHTKFRKPPVRFTFTRGESLDVTLPDEQSNRIVRLLTQGASTILPSHGARKIENPVTGQFDSHTDKALSSIAIFSYIAFDQIDSSGKGYIPLKTSPINLMTIEDDELKAGQVIVFRNTSTLLIQCAMIYIGEGVLMGWDSRFFFQTASMALEFNQKRSTTQTEICYEVLPSSKIPATDTPEWNLFIDNLLKNSPSSVKLLEKTLMEVVSGNVSNSTDKAPEDSVTP
ncbi:MAG: hypothetical protein ACR2PT_14830 [Endozoicomonas sp.]